MIADRPLHPRADAAGDSCLYVFGIVDGTRHLSPGDAAAMHDVDLTSAVLRLVAVDRVAAVYTALDPSSWKATTEDLLAEQLTTLARRHDAVVRSLAAHGPVLPMRLGTLCADAPRLLNVLRASTRQILAALDSVRGCSEWAIRVSSQPSTQMPEFAPAAGTGTDYLHSRRQNRLRQAAHARTAASAAADLDEEMSALARRHREQAHLADTLLAHSYLVPDVLRADLERALALSVDRLRDARCTVEVTGPLPPYSFADLRLEATS
jgi:hypothetical protein